MQVIADEKITEKKLREEGLGDLIDEILLFKRDRKDFPAGFFMTPDVSFELFCCLLLVL